MAFVTLTGGEAIGLGTGNFTVFGTSTGAETLSLVNGSTIVLDGSFNAGGDIIRLAGNAADFTAVRSGSSIVLTSGSGATAKSVTIPVGTVGASVQFADRTANLVFNTTTNNIELGGQVISTTPTAVTPGTGGMTPVAGSSFTLTTGADTAPAFTGTANNDTFNGNQVGANATFTVGDAIDGAAGTDTLNVIQDAKFAVPTGATVKNVEVINITTGATGNVVDGSLFTGLTTLTVSGPGQQTVSAPATVDITVSGVQADGAVVVNGGRNVTVAETGVTTGTTSVGQTTAVTGTALVTVAGATYVADAQGGGQGQGTIMVKGGTTVDVISTATTNNAGTVAGDDIVTLGNVTVTGTAVTGTVSVSQTKAATVAAAAGGLGTTGITNGTVTITDVNALSATAAGVINTVSLNGYAAGATVTSSALRTLNLFGTGGATVTADTVANLGANAPANVAFQLNTVGTAAGVVTLSNNVTTLNIGTSGTASSIATLNAANATAINIAGTAGLTLTTFATNAAAVINVTNAGATTIGTELGAGVVFTGGAGNETISTGATTKAITLGAGNDRVTASSVTLGVGGSVAAGDGTDTIVLSAANANTAGLTAVFNSKFSGFEVLDVLTGATTTSINLAGINGVQSVVTRGVAAGNTLTLDGYATGGTLTLTAAAGDATSTVAANIINAITNPADVFNVSLSNAGAATVEFGRVTLAGVETVNITLVDAGASAANQAATIDTATLIATTATSVTVTGNNGLNLTNAGNVAITSFNASGVVGNTANDTAANLGVTFVSANTTAAATVSITGGAGNDTLTGNAAKDTIVGGAGNDTISGAGGLDTLTGGLGSDIFVVAGLAADRDTVTDFTVGLTAAGGDQIQLSAGATTLATAAGAAPVVTADTTAAAAGAGAYTLTGVTTANADVIVLRNGAALTTGANGGDLSASTNGSELLRALTNADAADSFTGITAAANGNSVYLVAYQNGNAYVYLANDASNNGLIDATEIALVSTLNGVAANGLVGAVGGNYALLIA